MTSFDVPRCDDTYLHGQDRTEHLRLPAYDV